MNRNWIKHWMGKFFSFSKNFFMSSRVSDNKYLGKYFPRQHKENSDGIHVCRLNESRGFDAEKAGISNGKNGLNGGPHVGPLPPDGMYHVSDINGGSNGNTNIDMIHGSLTDKVNNKIKYPPSTCV